jgi:hypothetical protein
MTMTTLTKIVMIMMLAADKVLGSPKLQYVGNQAGVLFLNLCSNNFFI